MREPRVMHHMPGMHSLIDRFLIACSSKMEFSVTLICRVPSIASAAAHSKPAAVLPVQHAVPTLPPLCRQLAVPLLPPFVPRGNRF